MPAWMVRRDGKRFPVETHIFGNEEQFLAKRNGSLDPDRFSYSDLQETAEMAVWLYSATSSSKVKNNALTFIIMWLDFMVLPLTSEKRLIQVLQAVESKEIHFSTSDSLIPFIKKNKGFPNISVMDVSEEQLFTDAELLCRELDQEFLRVRLGGLYASTPGNKDFYARVSSIGFDWFNIIWKMAFDLKPLTITICRDYETTGGEGFYTLHGIIMDRVSYDDFISLPCIPVAEGQKVSRLDRLAYGMPIVEAFCNTNKERILHLTYARSLQENSQLVPWRGVLDLVNLSRSKPSK